MNMTSKAANDFAQNVREFVPDDRVMVDDGKVYLFPGQGGFGLPAEVYDGLDVALVESIGMDSLTESHRLFREDAHHVLIFKVNGYPGGAA